MKYIALIECTDAGGVGIGMAVTQMGYRPLFLLDPQLYRADTGLALQHFECRTVNTHSIDAIINELNPIRDQIAAIATLVDGRISIAAEVANKMGIPGPDSACIVLKDKAEVAKWCAVCSAPSLVLSADKKIAKTSLIEKFNGKKIIAKQRQGFGAIGIKILFSEDEKQNFIDETNCLDEWLIQEYFPGKLYSLEGWLDSSGVHILGWSSRKKINNTESEFKFEGFNTIDTELTDSARVTIEYLFKKAGLRRGWFHIEFLIDIENKNMILIDANIGRIGGAMLPHVLAMSLNIQVTDLYQHALEIQIFGKSHIEILPPKKLKKFYKCICFGSPHETVIQNVLLPKYPLEIGNLKVIRILGAGDHVAAMGKDDMSWIGFVAGEESVVDAYAKQIYIKTINQIYQATY